MKGNDQQGEQNSLPISLVPARKNIKATEHHGKTLERLQTVKAGVYCRVSTLMIKQGDSIVAQEQYFRQKIDADPHMELTDVYADHGKSGGSVEKRDEFRRMLMDAENHRIDMVFVKSISRLCRNLPDFVDAVQRLRECGTFVYFDEENLCTADRSSEFLINILQAIAAEELRSLSENVRLGMQARAASGHPVGRVAYGYKRIDQDANWEIVEDEAIRVRTAFQMAGTGATYSEILAVLNDIEAQAQSDVVWKKTRLYRMLTNIVYYGNVLTNKTYTVYGRKKVRKQNTNGERKQYLLVGHHDGIIDKELFDRVQTLIEHGLLHSTKLYYSQEEQELLNDRSWQSGSSMELASSSKVVTE